MHVAVKPVSLHVLYPIADPVAQKFVTLASGNVPLAQENVALSEGEVALLQADIALGRQRIDLGSRFLEFKSNFRHGFKRSIMSTPCPCCTNYVTAAPGATASRSRISYGRPSSNRRHQLQGCTPGKR
jgi:hypothetical protein